MDVNPYDANPSDITTLETKIKSLQDDLNTERDLWAKVQTENAYSNFWVQIVSVEIRIYI